MKTSIGESAAAATTASLLDRQLLLLLLLLLLFHHDCHSFSLPTTSPSQRSSPSISSSSITRHQRQHSSSFSYAVVLQMTSESNDDDFMKSLQSRMEQVQQDDNTLPIVVLDAMLPRQVLKIEVENDTFQSLVKSCIENERPRFGMIGTATLAQNGQTWPLQNGVEVEIVDAPAVVDGTGGDRAATPEEGGSASGKALRIKLVAGRRFRIYQNQLNTNPAGWTEAKVEFLDSEREAVEEEDALSIQKAKQIAQQLVDSGLIEKWIELARTKEHFDGQIDQLLEDLGEMPVGAESPSELAFWIGALINPLPGMGVAMEIRPQLLMAKTAQERIGTVYSGIEASINHMDGTKPLF